MPLLLDVVRHGEAVPPGKGEDAGRRLAPAGRAAIAELAAALARDGWRHDRVFSSPLVRAQETAEILAAETAPGAEIEILAELSPDHDPAAVLAALASRGASEGNLLLVSHQPLVGTLVRWLVGGAEPTVVPGSLTRIGVDAEPGSGRLLRQWRPGGS